MPGRESKSTLVFDVDQTLAGGVVQVHTDEYNRALNLGMTEDDVRLAGERYPKTFDIPQIIEYRKQNEERFQQVRALIRTSHAVHVALAEIPGASDQVIALTGGQHEFDHGGYYTVRPTEIEAATIEWLEKNGFPNPGDVVICDSHDDKINSIVDDHLAVKPPRGPQANPNAPIVALIDDCLSQLVEAARRQAADNPVVYEALGRLVVVGFGHSERQNGTFDDINLRTLALPSWAPEHVRRMAGEIDAIAEAVG